MFPTLFLSIALFSNTDREERKSFHFRSTCCGLVLTTLGFLFISFHPIERLSSLGMLFLIAGRLCFFLNIRRVSGFLIIRNWKNFAVITGFSFSFFVLVAIYLLPKISLIFSLAIILYVFLDTLLFSSIYFLWHNKKLHSTGIWAIIILLAFDLSGASGMFIMDLNDQFAISLYFGYLSIYLMYRFMLDLKMAEDLKNSDL